MENCLVTKLKAVVNNESLPKFGIISFNVVNSTGYSENVCKLSLKAAQQVKLEIDGDGYMASTFAGLSNPSQRTKEMVIEPSDSIYFSNGPYKVNLYNKYGIVDFMAQQNGTIFKLDIGIFEWSTLMSTIRLSSATCTGDISSLSKLTEATYFILRGAAVTGHLTDIANCKKLFRIDCSVNVNTVSGNLTDIATITSLQELFFEGNYYVKGTIESLAEGQIAAGRNSLPNPGTIQVKGTNNITYNGTGIAYKTATITFNPSLPNGYSVSVV